MQSTVAPRFPHKTVAFEWYLLAHFAKSQFWQTSRLLFAFFLTEACGLDVSTTGIILAASLAINGLSDWLLGIVLRDQVTDTPAALRLQARGAPLAALFFLAFCTTPLIYPAWRLGWAVMTLLSFRIAYSLIDVPQNAIVALASESPIPQLRWLASRNMVSAVAGLSVSLVATPLLLYSDDFTLYLIWAAVISALVCATAWLLGNAKLQTPQPLPLVRRVAHFDLPFPIVLTALAATVMASTLFYAMEPYFAAFVSNGVSLLAAGAVGSMISQLLCAFRQHRVFSRGLFSVAALLLLIAIWAMLSPLRSTTLGAMIIGFSFGVGTGWVWLMLWSAMMSRATHGRATYHVGAFTCVSKLAQSAAMLIFGGILIDSSYRGELREIMSLSSLLMVGGLLVLTLICIGLALMRGSAREHHNT